MRLTDEQVMQDNKSFAHHNVLTELKYCGLEIPHRKSISNADIHFYAWLCRSAVALLKEQEAVVRCKDCKHARRMCQPWNDLVCEKNGQVNKPDWFCADGERKEVK